MTPEEKYRQLSQSRVEKLFSLTGGANTSEIQSDTSLEGLTSGRADRLGDLSQGRSLSKGTFSVLPNGLVESNDNKVWNSYSGKNIQQALAEAAGEHQLRRDEATGKVYNIATGEEYKGDVRRAYMYGTKTDPNAVKFGLARGDLPSSDYRYIENGQKGYGWDPGKDGVDINKNYMDMLLPYNVATALEGMVHGRKDALANRAYKDIFSEKALKHGSGVSEYYTSAEGMLGDVRKERGPITEDLLEKNAKMSGAQRPLTAREINQQKLEALNKKQDANTRRWGNLIDGAQYAVGSKLAGMLDTGIEAAANIGERVSRNLGGAAGEEFYRNIREHGGIDIGNDGQYHALDKAKDAETYGYNTTRTQDAMKNVGDAYDKGDVLGTAGAILEGVVTAGPEFVVESAGEFLMAPLKTVGLALNAMDYTGQILDEKAKITSGKLDDADRAIAAIGGIAMSYINKLGIDEMIGKTKNVQNAMKVLGAYGTEKQGVHAAKKVLGLVARGTAVAAGKGIYEGLEEVAQEAISIVAEKAGTAEVDKILSSESGKRLTQAFGGGFGAGVTMRGPTLLKETYMAGKEVVGGKLGQKNAQTEKAKETAASGEYNPHMTEDELAEVAKGVESLGAVQTAEDLDIDELTKLKAKIQGIDPEDPIAGKQKEELLKQFEGHKVAALQKLGEKVEAYNPEDEKSVPVQFGSSRKAMVALMDYMDSKETIDSATEAKIVKIAEANGVDAKGIEKLKTYATVEKEATTGARGYYAIEHELDRLIEQEPDNAKAIIGKVKQLDGWKKTTETHVAEMTKAISNAATAANTFNLGIKNKTGEVKGALKERADGGGYTYTHKYKAGKGEHTYSVYLDSQADGTIKVRPDNVLLDAKKRNLNELSRVVSDKYKYIEANFKDVEEVQEEVSSIVDTHKLVIPTSTNESIERDRAIDRKAEATKAIVLESDLKVPEDKKSKGSKWTTYAANKLNKGKINPEEFSKDDVVMVSATEKFVTYDKKDKKYHLTEEGKAFKALIDKAMNAGATIVVDRTPMAKEVRRQILMFSKTNAENTAAGNKVKYKAVREETVSTNEKLKAKGMKVTKATRTFKPKEEADKINAETKVKLEAKNKVTADKATAKSKVEKLYLEAVYGEGDAKKKAEKAYKEAYDALYEGENPVYKKANAKGETKTEDGRTFYEVNKEKLEAAAKEKVEKIVNALYEAQVAEGGTELAVSNYADILKGLSEEVRTAVVGKVEGLLELAASIPDVLAVYNQMKELDSMATDEATEVQTRWAEILDKYGIEDKKVVLDVMENSVSTGMADVIVKMERNPNGSMKPIVQKEADLEKMTDFENINRTVVDINNVVEVSRSTLLNTIPYNLLGGNVMQYTKKAVAAINNVRLTAIKSLSTVMATSPGYSLLLQKTKDGYVTNPQVALIMQIALDEALDMNSYMLSAKPKSSEDLAQMLGIDDPSGVTREMRELVGDKGILLVSLVETVADNIKAHLGVKLKDSGVEYDALDRVSTDLAHMAILAEANRKGGLIEYVDDEVSITDFGRIVKGEKNKAEGAGFVKFVRERSNEPLSGKDENNESNKATTMKQYKAIVETMPGVQNMVKEAKMFDDKDGASIEEQQKTVDEWAEKKVETKTIRNDKAGFGIAKRAKQALKALMSVMWKIDTDIIREALATEESKMNLMKAMGWVDLENEDAISTFHLAKREAQESQNRDIERAIDALEKIRDTKGIEQKILAFDWFYTKNGRYMLDSNTLNPQTEKQLHRWFMHPKKSVVEYTVENEDTFLYKDLDVSDKVYFAITQALGDKVDKSNPVTIAKFAKAVLKYARENPEELDRVKEDLIAKGKAMITVDGEDITVHADHIGHSLVAIKMLKAYVERKDEKFSSYLSAEFDAVTSGFALKLFIMPLVGKMKDGKNQVLEDYLTKVGFITEDQLAKLNREDLDIGSVTTGALQDKLGDKEKKTVLDTYVTLATDDDINKIGTAATHAEVVTIIDTAINTAKGTATVPQDVTKVLVGYKNGGSFLAKTWPAIVKILPAPDESGAVGSALRNLFKQPFMEFNYSAAIKGIRKSLAYTLTMKIIDELMEQDESVQGTDNIAEAMVKSGTHLSYKKVGATTETKIKTVAELKDALRTVPLHTIKVGSSTNLEEYLMTLMDATYGHTIESIFQKNFKTFMHANDVINSGFNSMFGVFDLVYKDRVKAARVEGKGLLDAKSHKEVILGLINDGIFPSIKGPLSDENDMATFIGIYATDRAAKENANPVQTYVNKEKVTSKASGERKGVNTLNVTHTTKGLTEGGNAGAVVPIHYLDAAIMWYVVSKMKDSNKDMLSIHDAMISGLVDSDTVTYMYNEAVFKLMTGDKELQFDFLQALNDAMVGMQEAVGKLDKKYMEEKIPYKISKLEPDVKFADKPKEIAASKAFGVVLKDLGALIKEANANKESIRKIINSSDIAVGHAATTVGGTLRASKGTIVSSDTSKQKDATMTAEETVNDIVAGLSDNVKRHVTQVVEKVKEQGCGNGM